MIQFKAIISIFKLWISLETSTHFSSIYISCSNTELPILQLETFTSSTLVLGFLINSLFVSVRIHLWGKGWFKRIGNKRLPRKVMHWFSCLLPELWKTKINILTKRNILRATVLQDLYDETWNDRIIWIIEVWQRWRTV